MFSWLVLYSYLFGALFHLLKDFGWNPDGSGALCQVVFPVLAFIAINQSAGRRTLSLVALASVSLILSKLICLLKFVPLMPWFCSSLEYAAGKLFSRFITCASDGLRNKMKTFFLKCLTVLEAWGFAADSPEWKWMRSFSSGSALASSKLPFSCPSGRKWGVSYYEVEKSSRTREDSAEKHLRMIFLFFF